jgi:cold shock CspA family protein
MNIQTSTIKTYNPDKGFGFVTLSDLHEDLFFHISNVKNIESQLGTSDLKLWVEMSTNNRGSYVSKAWASRDKIPEEYLHILEKKEAHKRDKEAKRELKINGTQEEHNAREELIRKITYLNLCTVLQPEEEGIRSLCVTAELYQILLKRMRCLQTTSFNHGKGVERYYTHNYCLQRTYGNSGTRHYIKRGGSPFPRSVDKNKYSNKTIKVCTPSFKDMCHGILRDYRSDILYINS